VERIIKVKCNGAGKHVNDVNLDKVFMPVLVAKGVDMTTQMLSERLVLPCRECTIGRVILTREMLIEINRQHG
jgi:hypothetical protein